MYRIYWQTEVNGIVRVTETDMDGLFKHVNALIRLGGSRYLIERVKAQESPRPPRPRPSSAVRIYKRVPETRYISFWCDDRVADQFREFGYIYKDKYDSCWVIKVDGRFEYEQVANYIASYDGPTTTYGEDDDGVPF
jgi:hypothetical protein